MLSQDMCRELGSISTEVGDMTQVPHFLLSTARKPKVRFDTMAEMKPIQLKDSSAADAMATPTCGAE